MTLGLDIRVDDLSHTYAIVETRVHALTRVSFTVEAGSSTAIAGPSGSGKSTLFAIIAGLQKPSSGTVRIGPHQIDTLSEPALLRLRRSTMAVLPQRADRNVLGYATALQNLRFAQRGARADHATLPEPLGLLEQVGLSDFADHPADRLSGGERQRLALATALATAPSVLLADEPTSSLDRPNRDHLVELLLTLARSTGATLLTITHDPDVAAAHQQRLHLRDGTVKR